MTELCALPAPAFTLLEIWAFMLIVLGSANTAYALFLKQRVYGLWGGISFALAFFLWQGIFDCHQLRFQTGEATAALTEGLGRLPWTAWLWTLILLTFGAGVLFLHNCRYRRSRVNPMAVKLCADKMPWGVCYWRQSGRVVLSNLSMNRLCIALTGQSLLNGSSFRSALPGEVVQVQGRDWRFSSRQLELEGEPLFELIASDITEERKKTRALARDAAGLARVKRELQTYQAGIEESVRRQEILQAKINIHDEMNRLMLATVAAGSGTGAEPDAVLSLWERNALLLCMEADGGGKELKELQETAELLNLRLLLPAQLPSALTASQQELFFSAAQEAMVNAVKHARASRLTATFEETGEDLRCIFENDGTVPRGEVPFTGGLANLRLLAKKQKGMVLAQGGETFRLTLVFPKNHSFG